MARCHGPNSPYGCGHTEEHRRAALLGWRRKRHGKPFQESEERRYASLFAGGDVSHAHEHESHKGRVLFRHKGKWYEVPKREWRGFLRIGRDMARDQDRERKQAEREQKRLERERATAERKEQARRRAEQRQREMEERAYRRVQDQERAGVARIIRQAGGIKATGKHDRGEVASLPGDLRRKNGVPLDRARELVDESFPWLNLSTPDDLVQYLEGHRVSKMHRQKIA